MRHVGHLPRIISSLVWNDRGKSRIPARIVPILLTSKAGAFRMRVRRVIVESIAAILLILWERRTGAAVLTKFCVGGDEIYETSVFVLRREDVLSL